MIFVAFMPRKDSLCMVSEISFWWVNFLRPGEKSTNLLHSDGVNPV